MRYSIFLLLLFNVLSIHAGDILLECDRDLIPLMDIAARAWMHNNDIKVQIKFYDEAHDVDNEKIRISDERIIKISGSGRLSGDDFCATAIIFGIAKENPLENLSLKEASGILDGTTTHWRDDAKQRMAIHVFVTNGNKTLAVPDDIRLATQSHEQQDKKEKKTQTQIRFITNDRAKTISFTASDSDGIALLNITDFNIKELKLLSVDGVKPTIDNVLSGKYPLGKKYVIKDPENEFTEYLRAREFAGIMLKNGFFPLTLLENKGDK